MADLGCKKYFTSEVRNVDWSFQEKSICGSLVITVGLFSYYFLEVYEVLTSGISSSVYRLPIALIGVIVAMVAVEVVYHILIAVGSGPENEDERDRLIEAKATRYSYFVLATGCVTTVGHAMFAGYFDAAGRAELVHGPIMIANFIVLSFVLAEVVGFAMQLYYYRRGF